MLEASELCSARMLSPFRDESGDEELSVLPRHTKVVVTGNNRTKSVLVGLQGVVKKAVGLGGWHWLVLKNGVEVKLQRNALSVLEHPTGNEVGDEDDLDLYNSSGSDIDNGSQFHRFSKPRVRPAAPPAAAPAAKSTNHISFRDVQSIIRSSQRVRILALDFVYHVELLALKRQILNWSGAFGFVEGELGETREGLVMEILQALQASEYLSPPLSSCLCLESIHFVNFVFQWNSFVTLGWHQHRFTEGTDAHRCATAFPFNGLYLAFLLLFKKRGVLLTQCIFQLQQRLNEKDVIMGIVMHSARRRKQFAKPPAAK
ncbi:unnamed protein product [Linum tenue]|uniref:Uncharacterized protein n=1 Tax=Linum tenue TaxID=586396 RepID=A0AAV0JX66_9ROSI|nr:unnamed protein product [Linum tenue]